jgi:MFS family permease
LSVRNARVDRRALALVCLLGLVGFGHESVMAAVLPLVVIDRGGDAALVGILVAAYGIPTIALRPIVGRLLDTPSRSRVIRIGAATIGLAPLGFLLPSLPTMIVTRVIQGSGWAAYGTSGHALLARLAPPERRSEAAGYYNAMPALAVLLGPATGLWLYTNVSGVAPFLLASALGFAGLAIAWRLPGGRVERADVVEPPRPAVRLVAGLFDRSAIVPMLIVGSFMSVQSLFVIFAPLYAREKGIPIEQLAIYYPAFGIVVLAGHLGLGRMSDRFGRRPVVAFGCLLAIAGLCVAALGAGLVTLTVAAILYGVATSLITSTVSAVTMESAPPERSGSAMATYSVGYQLGASVGGAAWGTVITLVGYPWPFILGAGMVAGTLVFAWLRLPRGAGRVPDRAATGPA